MDFWEQSCGNIDLKRVQAYTESFDLDTDEITGV